MQWRDTKTQDNFMAKAFTSFIGRTEYLVHLPFLLRSSNNNFQGKCWFKMVPNALFQQNSK